ncbi:hypothetical protein CRYUN_Cryun22dG0036300 [Craigia yunnanensis]
MTEDGGSRVSSHDLTVTNDASQTRQRKRKWDQPAEALVSAGFSVPFSNLGTLSGMSFPGVAPVPGTFLSNPLAVSGTAITPVFQQHAAPVVSKQNQPKIQDELVIAREIVINDAESSVRYKLTKRQTQEEIQRCTGAVVITRGKYHPPNAPPDGEKPLYLHISAGAHQLKETAERILAVDRAAAMVEEMLKHGQSSQAGSSPFMEAMSNGVKALSTCVYLGFDADPSLNVAARIRGPNDQYINHIMNETGATVILRGCGSGNFESLQAEEAQQPLHLFLSSNNPKSLDDAKRLAENLLDTISVEFGASRASSSKVYGAVPPPKQLLTGVQSSASERNVYASSAAGLTSMPVTTPAPPITVSGVTTGYSQGMVGGMRNSGPTLANSFGYPQPLVTRGTSYIGYGGIYPQATPLQQVALALRQSSPISSTVVPATSVASTVFPTTSAAGTVSKSSVSSTLHSEEQRHPQKRKFQELPAGSKAPARPNQESESLNPSKPSGDLTVKNVSAMPAPKKLVHPSSNGMPAPPSRTLPPPPPPKFTSSTPSGKSHDKNKVTSKAKLDAVPDTLVQLMAYGDEDDDSEESSDESLNRNSNANAVRKPFWAL